MGAKAQSSRRLAFRGKSWHAPIRMGDKGRLRLSAPVEALLGEQMRQLGCASAADFINLPREKECARP